MEKNKVHFTEKNFCLKHVYQVEGIHLVRGSLKEKKFCLNLLNSMQRFERISKTFQGRNHNTYVIKHDDYVDCLRIH